MFITYIQFSNLIVKEKVQLSWLRMDSTADNFYKCNMSILSRKPIFQSTYSFGRWSLSEDNVEARGLWAIYIKITLLFIKLPLLHAIWIHNVQIRILPLTRWDLFTLFLFIPPVFIATLKLTPHDLWKWTQWWKGASPSSYSENSTLRPKSKPICLYTIPLNDRFLILWCRGLYYY